MTINIAVPRGTFSPRTRGWLTAIVGSLELVMSVLALYDCLDTSYVQSHFSIVNDLINTKWWGGMFLISGILVFIRFTQPRVQAVAMSISSGLFLVWGTLSIISSMTAVGKSPQSSGWSVLAAGLAAYFLSQSWNTLLVEEQLECISREADMRVANDQ